MAANVNQPKVRCKIKNLDKKGVEVEAHFNPKELSIDKSVPWNKHKTSKGNNPVLEFTDAEPENFSVELFFDTYESRKNVWSEKLEILRSMTLIDDALKRPPMCLFWWGSEFPQFMGVIESLSIKYTMFLTDGTPCRATATLKMKQAEKLTNSTAGANAHDDYSAEGQMVGESDALRADKYGGRDALDAAGSEDGRMPSDRPVPKNVG